MNPNGSHDFLHFLGRPRPLQANPQQQLNTSERDAPFKAEAFPGHLPPAPAVCVPGWLVVPVAPAAEAGQPAARGSRGRCRTTSSGPGPGGQDRGPPTLASHLALRFFLKKTINPASRPGYVTAEPGGLRPVKGVALSFILSASRRPGHEAKLLLLTLSADLHLL